MLFNEQLAAFREYPLSLPRSYVLVSPLSIYAIWGRQEESWIFSQAFQNTESDSRVQRYRWNYFKKREYLMQQDGYPYERYKIGED